MLRPKKPYQWQRKPINRGTKQIKRTQIERRRKALKKVGKKGREAIRVRRLQKLEFAAMGITTCELRLEGCLIDDGLGFMHAQKRRNLSAYDLRHTVLLACNWCHWQWEKLGEAKMQELVVRHIDEREETGSMKATTITVEVTEEDIAEAQRRDCRKCPIALAVKRHFPDDDVLVMSTAVWVQPYGKVSIRRLAVSLPPAATHFIKKFDTRKPVEPLTFQLNFR